MIIGAPRRPSYGLFVAVGLIRHRFPVSTWLLEKGRRVWRPLVLRSHAAVVAQFAMAGFCRMSAPLGAGVPLVQGSTSPQSTATRFSWMPSRNPSSACSRGGGSARPGGLQKSFSPVPSGNVSVAEESGNLTPSWCARRVTKRSGPEPEDGVAFADR